MKNRPVLGRGALPRSHRSKPRRAALRGILMRPTATLAGLLLLRLAAHGAETADPRQWETAREKLPMRVALFGHERGVYNQLPLVRHLERRTGMRFQLMGGAAAWGDYVHTTDWTQGRDRELREKARLTNEEYEELYYQHGNKDNFEVIARDAQLDKALALLHNFWQALRKGESE